MQILPEFGEKTALQPSKERKRTCENATQEVKVILVQAVKTVINDGKNNFKKQKANF